MGTISCCCCFVNFHFLNIIKDFKVCVCVCVCVCVGVCVCVSERERARERERERERERASAGVSGRPFIGCAPGGGFLGGT